MNLKILGIDPGSRNCGYAIIEANKGKNILIEAGLIKIKPRTLQYQITELCEGLDLIFKNHSFDEVAKFGIIFMGKTGHYNIKKMMKEKNIDLAAEVSGHICFKHRYFGYDDGIYAFLRALELVYKGFDLESMIKALPKLYT
ncbi:crossover junction endodeoxyribonuclease RuvC, partial [Campylobacter jejuni]|uniref:crossover junction endodeoxyribonuclease RuvC n=1 Tax=Campylobacter jejuni TaxID=197 RepID=UPI002042F178